MLQSSICCFAVDLLSFINVSRYTAHYMTLLPSIIWIDHLMNYLLLRLKRNLSKIICFYFFSEFFTSYGGISAELIITTKNSLINQLSDMTMHREVNVCYKGISVAIKTLIFAYFSAKLCQTLFKLKNLICLVLDSVSFYKKMFFWLEGKTLHLAYQIFERWEKKKKTLNVW